MCGIVGKLRFDGAPVSVRTISEMTDSLSHRGPDYSDVWCQGVIGLGHRRLAIRDLSELGRQPLSDESGAVFVSYNGEIYNYWDLRHELEKEHGVVFRSTCDTELIPYAYLNWGKSAFNRFEGMFAIAIWDTANQKLLLSRDALGVKPLYYFKSNSCISFGSELKAVLADVDVSRDLDISSVGTFLALGYAGPAQSLLKNIHQVGPAEILDIDTKGEFVRTRYWQVKRNNDIRTLEEAVEAFGGIWPRVMEDIMQSDTPVALLQSGGIDSSLISTQLQKNFPDRPLYLFTGVFADKRFNESVEAARVAAHIGARHEIVNLDLEKDAENTFIEVATHLDGQLADSSAYAVYVLGKHVAAEYKVAISGDGADELFSGYATYSASWLASGLRKTLPAMAWQSAANWLWRTPFGTQKRIPLNQQLARFCDGLSNSDIQPHAEWRRLTRDTDLEKLFNRDFLAQHANYHPCKVYSDYIGDGSWDDCLLADQQYYLPSDMLMKVDAMSMAHSLEVRVPFLDRRVVEIANSIDTRVHAKRFGQGKLVLRKYYESLGGMEAISRRNKTGFNVPIDDMLRGSLRSLGEQLLVSDSFCLQGLLDKNAIAQMWKKHQEGRCNYGYTLWALMTLAVWESKIT